MNGKKSKKIRKVALATCKTKETSYFEALKHNKVYRQKLSLDEMKKRTAKSEDEKFSMKGFVEGGMMVGDILQTSIQVSTRVLAPDCFRAKYKGLKKNWDQVVKNVPSMTEALNGQKV